MQDKSNRKVVNGKMNLYTCRFHPTDWWHEIGCPHMKWTKKQLQEALDQAKENEQKQLEVLTFMTPNLGKRKSNRKVMKNQTREKIEKLLKDAGIEEGNELYFYPGDDKHWRKKVSDQLEALIQQEKPYR